MKPIWEFFENLNEFVYAADMDTFEIVYMNKKMFHWLGFSSLGEVVGKKCYEVIQNCSEPCVICTNSELSPGQFKEWWHYNPRQKKHFVLKDTMVRWNRRRIHVQFAFDTSSLDWLHNSYQDLEAIVNEGLRIALAKPTPDQSIMALLEYLGKALGGERTYIFEKNESGRDDNTYEWTATGIEPQKENLQDLPPDICANWYNQFVENKNIMIEELEEIRESDPLQYENLKRQKIHSLVVVPLYENGKAIGFYGVDNPPPESLEYASNILQIAGHFMVSSLKRRNLMRELERMSYSDQLTKLGNRHAMRAFVKSKLEDCEKIGAVYCDITGLKEINDRDGHDAGDRYILRACESLESAFGGFGLFRIGGDELLALCPGIERSEMDERIALMKKVMKEKGVVMAAGAVWKCGGRYNLDQILTESEALMYKDKAAYYRAEGIDRRR